MKHLFKILPKNTKGIELTAIASWIALVVFLFNTTCSDPVCNEVVKAGHPIVWITGLLMLSVTHLFAIYVSDEIGYLGRMVCSLVGMFLAIYLTTLGFLLDPDIFIIFAIGLCIGLSWTVIRHGLVK